MSARPRTSRSASSPMRGRPAYDTRIERMIAATAAMEFVSTRTEAEALLLEANLIKRLRPRFNVLLRDDKSFPYILITDRPPSAADPQASRRAQPRRATITARSPRPGRSTAPSRRCSARSCCAPAPTACSRAAPGPACSTRSSAAPRPAPADRVADYGELVREAQAFLSGKSRR